MSEAPPHIEKLLAILQDVGVPGLADELRARFVEADWRLTGDDLGVLQSAVTAGLTGTLALPIHTADPVFVAPAEGAPPAPARATRVTAAPVTLPVSPKATTSDLPEWLVPLTFLEPFLRSVDDTGPRESLRLLSLVNSLLRASTFNDLQRCVHRLFVEEFRFDDAGSLDELPRLPQVNAFAGIIRVAEFQDLCVLAVNEDRVGVHSTSYNPLFQLHRRCLVFAFSPSLQRLRVVCRGVERIADYRTLVGRASERDPLENLVTITRRLSHCRPNGTETPRQLEEKARRALLKSVPTLADDWESRSLSKHIAGAPWSRLLAEEISGFTYRAPCGTDELHWGLGAALRHRFPIPVAKAKGKMELLNWQLIPCEETSTDRWALIASAKSRAATIRLHLRTCTEEDEWSEPFSLELELPLPDPQGEMIMDGMPLQLVFGQGELVDDALPDWRERDNELDEDAEGEPTDESDESSSPAKEDSTASDEEIRNSSREAPETCSFSTLWSFFVEKRFAAVAKILWDAESVPTDTSEFLRLTRRIRTRNREFSMLAVSHLWPHVRTNRNLKPVEFPMIAQSSAVPPSWACLEMANITHDGKWLPIEGARLHPCGELAVPTESSNGHVLAVRELGAHGTQARWNTTARLSPPSWWLSAPLSFFSSAPGGQISYPLASLDHSTTLQAQRVKSQVLKIIVSESSWISFRAQRLTSLRFRDIPTPVAQTSPERPRLELEKGDEASRGESWLHVPLAAWRSQRDGRSAHVADAARGRLGLEERTETDYFRLHLGPDEYGRVESLQLSDQLGPSGGIQGWRAAIELSSPVQRWVAGLPDGRSAQIEVCSDCDMPYGADGDVIPVCVLDPAFSGDGTMLFDGQTGDFLGGAEALELLVGAVHDTAEACPPDMNLRYRLIDGEGQPADGSSPQINDEWRNFLAAAHPEQAKICDSAEIQANAGVPPSLGQLQLFAHSSQLPIRVLDRPDLKWDMPQHGTPFDPALGRIGKVSRLESDRASSLFEYRCDCGEARDWFCAGLTCPACNTQVIRAVRSEIAGANVTVHLDEPLIHPWAKPQIGALLGITQTELNGILCEYPAVEVCAHLKRMVDPFAALNERIRSDILPEEAAKELRRYRTALEIELECIASFDEFVDGFLVENVSEPVLLRESTGLQPGTSVLQSPSLMLNYRALQAALSIHGELADVARVDILARAALNETLDMYWGRRSIAPSGELGTLRSCLLRLMPLHRTRDRSHVVPGMFRASGNYIEDFEESLELFGDCPDSPIQNNESTGVLSEDGLAVLSGTQLCILSPPIRPIDVSTAQSWCEHFAFKQLLARNQTHIAALAVAAESLQWPDERWAKSDWPADVDRALLGQVILRTIWAQLQNPESHPSALYQIFDSEKSWELPSNVEEAEALVSINVRTWLPLETPLGDFVRDCLTQVLTGWARFSSNDYGEHVSWTSSQRDIPTRFVPTLESRAWELLPGVAPLLDPIGWVQRGGDLGASPVVRQLFRSGDYEVAPVWEALNVEPAPAQEAIQNTTEQSTPAIESTAEEASEESREESMPPSQVREITVYEGTVQAWMR